MADIISLLGVGSFAQDVAAHGIPVDAVNELDIVLDDKPALDTTHSAAGFNLKHLCEAAAAASVSGELPVSERPDSQLLENSVSQKSDNPFTKGGYTNSTHTTRHSSVASAEMKEGYGTAAANQALPGRQLELVMLPRDC